MIVRIITYERSTLVTERKVSGRASSNDLGGRDGCQVVIESILETKATTILELFAALRGTLWVTFEDGTCSVWLNDLLDPYLDELAVCNARKSALLKE